VFVFCRLWLKRILAFLRGGLGHLSGNASIRDDAMKVPQYPLWGNRHLAFPCCALHPAARSAWASARRVPLRTLPICPQFAPWLSTLPPGILSFVLDSSLLLPCASRLGSLAGGRRGRPPRATGAGGDRLLPLLTDSSFSFWTGRLGYLAGGRRGWQCPDARFFWWPAGARTVTHTRAASPDHCVPGSREDFGPGHTRVPTNDSPHSFRVRGRFC
jgi:hypothetical protein